MPVRVQYVPGTRYHEKNPSHVYVITFIGDTKVESTACCVYTVMNGRRSRNHKSGRFMQELDPDCCACLSFCRRCGWVRRCGTTLLYGLRDQRLFILFIISGTYYIMAVHASMYIHYTCSVYSLPYSCLLYTSPSPRDKRQSRMPSSA